ncbi:MAG: histidinol-phosphatase [Desulfosarcina sp.]
MKRPHPVSVHGGHSGQFCGHATDTLEEIVLAYIAHGYPWVGITEHMPPVSDTFVYPEEKRAGLDAAALERRFAGYMTDCRRLQTQYAADIRILVGFETESCSGSIESANRLISTYSPDYIVGSVHHVKDIPFDYNPRYYRQAAERCGGLDGLYGMYFDQQYEMIQLLKPSVVGHLDIIRIFDPGYRDRITEPGIWDKIVRNLALIERLDLILDFNLRPLSRGENEAYPTASILKKACELGIAIVPGDDSHGVKDIGTHMARAIELLQAAGAGTSWRKPAGSPGDDVDVKTLPAF